MLISFETILRDREDKFSFKIDFTAFLKEKKLYFFLKLKKKPSK